MYNLTSGRKEPCKDNIGGIKGFWVAKYVKHAPNDIIRTPGVELFEIPTAFIFFFEVLNGGEFTQNIEVLEDGSKFYNQKLTVKLKKMNIQTSLAIKSLQNSEWRVVVERKNGQLHIMGLINGCEVLESTSNSGGAKKDGNGYEFSFEAKEKYMAEEIADLDDVGFTKEPLLLNARIIAQDPCVTYVGAYPDAVYIQTGNLTPSIGDIVYLNPQLTNLLTNQTFYINGIEKGFQTDDNGIVVPVNCR